LRPLRPRRITSDQNDHREPQERSWKSLREPSHPVPLKKTESPMSELTKESSYIRKEKKQLVTIRNSRFSALQEIGT